MDLENKIQGYHALVKSHGNDAKALAEAEHRIWTTFVLNTPGKHGKKCIWLSKRLGGSIYSYEQRSILLSDSPITEPFWPRLKDGMSLSVAIRLYRNAKKLAANKRIPVDDAVKESLTEYDFGTQVNYPAEVKESELSLDTPQSTKELKRKVYAITENYIEYLQVQDPSLDPFKLKTLKTELNDWLEDGFDTFTRKVNKLRADSKDSRLLKIGKTRFNQAVEILGLKPGEFVFGKPIPLKVARKAHLARARHLHPDMNQGSREREHEFFAVNEAYNLLETYAEQFGGSK